MKIGRKQLIGAIVGVFVIGAGATGYALQNNNHAESLAPQVSKAQKIENTEPVVEAEKPADTVIQQKTTPVTAAPEPQPLYGENPSEAGVYKVYDKTSVMNSAGVPLDQQATADTLISMRMNWIYHRDSFPNSNLCYIAPIEKMAAAGSDYKMNPVTQLTYCNNYIIGRYGSWKNALNYYLEKNIF